MEKRTYPLRHATPGTETVVTAFCFGPHQAQRKIYIQASLHADELPGSLVAHHLFERLERLEDGFEVNPVDGPFSEMRRRIGRQCAGPLLGVLAVLPAR